MGKVQKKAFEKHKASLSPAFKDFIDKTISLPLDKLADHLSSFPSRWLFPRGDLYNWIGCLDRFDGILERFIHIYGLQDGPQTRPFGNELLSQDGSDATDRQTFGDARGDESLIESILVFSRVLLEKCGNRSLYNSTERLNDLLNTTSSILLHKTLRLTLFLAQRYADRPPSSPQPQFYHYDLDRLQKLAAPLPKPSTRRSPQSPVKSTKSKDRLKPSQSVETLDPNNLEALARDTVAADNRRAKSRDNDWATCVTIKMAWTPTAQPTDAQAPVNHPQFREAPMTPTPLRQQPFDLSSPSTTGNEPASGGSVPISHSGTQYVDLDAADITKTTAEAILAEVPSSMPPSSRYELLHKLRIGYGLITSAETRSLLLQNRITAMAILGHVYLEEDFIGKCFQGELNSSSRQQLVHQLASLLRAPRSGQNPVSLYTKTLATELLQILGHFQRFSIELGVALSPTSNHGLLLTLIKEVLADMAQDDDSTDDEVGDDWREATYSLFSIFVPHNHHNTPRGSDTYMHRSLVDAYIAGLDLTTEKSLRVHSKICDFVTNFMHSFRDGIQILLSNGAFASICSAVDKLSEKALLLIREGKGFPVEYRPQSTDYETPYKYHFVLRSLIALVNEVPIMQGNNADRALRSLVDSSALLNGFRTILSHMNGFGAHLWSEVVKVVCAFLNNEPTSYTVVSEAGLITTLLEAVHVMPSQQSSDGDSVQPRNISATPTQPSLKLPAVGEAITNLASAFSAICLTEAGHKYFLSSGVLDKFFEIFESPAHVSVLKDRNVCMLLGSTFDELVRHHPALRNAVVSSVIVMIARVRHICKSKAWSIGSGPKIWMDTTSGRATVEGGLTELLAPDVTEAGNSGVSFPPLELPNKDTLTSGSAPSQFDNDLIYNATDIDSDGLTVVDYATAAIGFLLTFMETSYVIDDILTTGADSLILDFISLPTFPVSPDSFSAEGHLNDLALTVKRLAESRPHIVLPQLLERARRTFRRGLEGLTTYSPARMQSYFGRFLELESQTQVMDVDHVSRVDGTKTVKCLMELYCFAKIFAHVLMVPPYQARTSPVYVLNQTNVVDILVELIDMFGQLSAVCSREEIALVSMIPQSWLNATKPSGFTTGNHDVDVILSVSDTDQTEHDGTPTSGSERPKTKRQDSLSKVKDTAAFRNLRTLRYLLIEVPGAIASLFGRIGSALNGKKRSDRSEHPNVRQRIGLVSEALASAMMMQLDPPFISTAFNHADEIKSREWHFKYLTVALSRVHESLSESTSTTSSHTRLAYVVDRFRNAGGLKVVTKIGTLFFHELTSALIKFGDQSFSDLKAYQLDPPTYPASSGLKICLELLNDFTHSDFIASSQANFMKNTDPARPLYFNPEQSLLELRMESLPLTRLVWNHEFAENAPLDIVRRLAMILKHTLIGDHEEHAIARSDEYPRLAELKPKKFVVDKSKVQILVSKGYDEDLAEEAIFRAQVLPDRKLEPAEQYCEAFKRNPTLNRVPFAPQEVVYKEITSTESVEVTGTGPTVLSREQGSLAAAVATEPVSDNEVIADVMNYDRDSPNPSQIQLQESSSVRPSTQSPMSLETILNQPTSEDSVDAQPVTASMVPCYSVETMNAERESIREDLAERCNNILGNHEKFVWELDDLLNAATSRLSGNTAKSWWEATTNLLTMSLLSQSINAETTESQGKKIAATAHLLGLLCNNDMFKLDTIKVLNASFGEFVDFLRMPIREAKSDEPWPWIGRILLILEKVLATEAEPDEVVYSPPIELNTVLEPPQTKRHIMVDTDSKEYLLTALVELFPRVGKDKDMAESIIRVLVILTRGRAASDILKERKNLQKLFLMVRQLASGMSPRLESTFMIILRHIIEDDTTVKQIMRSEIVAYFSDKTGNRRPDAATYVRDLNYLALRSPKLFLEVSKELIKFTAWGASNVPVTLRDEAKELVPAIGQLESTIAQAQPQSVSEAPVQSVEQVIPASDPDSEKKKDDIKLPVVEHPDGIIHFLLSELLSYKDVEDKPSEATVKSDTVGAGAGHEKAETNGVSEHKSASLPSEKVEKPRYKAEEHPIFVYRCFLLHCLAELLYAYNQTKIEFINFSRKADPMATTPSKPRSGVLNYLLNALVSSGYVEKDDSIDCKKRMATSDLAMKVVVALCTKTGETGIAGLIPSRSPLLPSIEDDGMEPDLTFVRRFVLEHAIKAFKDATTSVEAVNVRHGRMLCLADLFRKLIAKPTGVADGSSGQHNNSYRMLARMMFEKNLISILTSAISDIDLSLPGANKVVKFILRPLQELTTGAVALNTTQPEKLAELMNASAPDNISSASSDVSEDIDSDREETPDLYRNSALGILDPDRQDGSDDSEDDEDDDDQDMYDEGYEDEMEYENAMASVNDGEVVSDEELEDDMDGPVEGLSGDAPMDIEFVVDEHSHDPHHGTESTSEDDDDDEDDDEDDEIEVEEEIEDADADGNNINQVGAEDDGDSWEDADEEDVEELVGEDFEDFIEDDPTDGQAHLGNLLRILGEPDMNAGADEVRAEPLIQPPTLLEEEDDNDAEEDEDMDENDSIEYDQPFDLMLDDPDDYDENDDWIINQPTTHQLRRAHRHQRLAQGVPMFQRRYVYEDDLRNHPYIPRHHRTAPSGRPVPDDGVNPLLRRPDMPVARNAPHAGFTSNVEFGSTQDRPMLFGSTRRSVFDNTGREMTISMEPGSGGHGAILDAIMSAIQRDGHLQPQRMQFTINEPQQLDSLQDFLQFSSRYSLGMNNNYPAASPRSSREDPMRSTQFTPMITVARWQEEIRILFDKNAITKTRPIQLLLISMLVPLAQQDEKERRIKAEEERKAQAEREAQAKIEEERKQKEEEERLAKERAETEERERVAAAAAREAAVAAEAEARSAAPRGEEPDQPTSDAMEGVESTEMPSSAEAAADTTDQSRSYINLRGRQVDITGLDIDLEYLEALPEDLREEVIMTQYQSHREQVQEEGGQDTSTVDPDFLNALPEDIREELRQQEAMVQRRREREEARRQAQVAAGAIQAVEPDNDDFFAMLDPGLRRQILAEQPPEILAQLNPQHAAEGRAHARLFHQRAIPREVYLQERNRRRIAATRDPRRQLLQLVDQAGVATLLRLMFLQQQGSIKSNLMQVLSNICGNRQTRFEVVSLLLIILKEGSIDVPAVEKSLASLSLRAKAAASVKTPQTLRRTLSAQPFAGVSEDVTPMLVVQQCINALKSICEHNNHVKMLFIREVDVTTGSKSKTKGKEKKKDFKMTKYPINDLMSLLDRSVVMSNGNCLDDLSHLLSLVTSPIGQLTRQERERKKAEEEKAKEQTKTADDATEGKLAEDTPMQDAALVDAGTGSADIHTTEPVEGQATEHTQEQLGPEGRKSFEPPVIEEQNLRLVASIFVAPECGGNAFHAAIETIKSLSYIEGATSVLAKEFTAHVHNLATSICADLQELLPVIKDAQSGVDVQGVAAIKFSASTSDQVKLLRVLKAMRELPADMAALVDTKDRESVQSILRSSYASLGLTPLWMQLGDCLSNVEEKGDTISFANILLPLIESLMVVCEGTTLKDAPVVAQAHGASVTQGNMDDLETLFYKFTTDHRKILNEIVRQSPKLMQGPSGSFSILVKNSKVLDFDNKRSYFNKQIHNRDTAQRHPQPPLQLNVRRDQVFGDSYKALYYKSAEEMKYGKLNIRFSGEEGVDAGGVTREWFHVLARGMFDPNYALFQPVASDRTTFHPSPLSQINPDHLLYFKFIGRIIGKALHENRVLDCHFSRALYKRILGQSPNLKDLESNDVDYHNSLVWILENDISDALDAEFSVVEDEFGEQKIVDLIPDGRNIAVTEENKREYVQKLVEYRLTDSVKDQLDNFLVGFHDIIPAELISIFNEQELELLISGLPEIDVDDWKANTEYHNYNPSSQQIVWFWRIVRAMSNEERAKLLQFITGTSKVPLNGFKELEGVSGQTKCNIHKDPSTTRLPTSHTCFNQLDLPAYESFEVMKQNLTTAINLGADYFGFA